MKNILFFSFGYFLGGLLVGNSVNYLWKRKGDVISV